jgi:signal transduction histidine kinase
VDFTELLATAIANADSRAELAASEARARELAHEQAALRRVATLVAQGASPDAVFTAVAEEVAGIINTPIVAVFRYESDGTCTTLGVAGESSFVVGSRWPVEEEGISGMILASGRPARKDDYSTIGGQVGEAVREAQIVATVGVPIVVEGSIWGFMVAEGRHDRPIPIDTEERLARFTELVATAVSNATMRGELVASRARIIVAADDARRRIEHDLHDGAQQQLVTLALAMRSTEGRIPTGQEQLKAAVGGFADRVTSVVEELREMSRGIHPAILRKGGLSPALEALSLRSAVPVRLNVRDEQRLPDAVEVAAYYVAAEALTNASKHADASRVELDLHIDDAKLRLSIRDDGVGGADPSRGSGLIGLKDRVEALGGTIEVESAHGRGTTLRVAIPVPAESSTG